MSAIAQQTPTRMEVGDLRRPLIGGLIVAALFGLVYYRFLARQVRWAMDAPADWGHTLVMPLIAGYFVYLAQDKLTARPFRTTWFGLVPLVFGLLFYSVCIFGSQTLNHHNLHGFGFSVSLFGLVLLFAGWRAMKWLWFPLAYMCVFGQAISKRLMDMVTEPMQDLAAAGAHLGLVAFGALVERNGNVLTMVSNGREIPLNIAEACSGMRMLMAFLALGVAMAVTAFPPLRPARSPGTVFRAMMRPAANRSALAALLAIPAAILCVPLSLLDLMLVNWQRVLLVALAVPTAIFVNILRIITLAVLAMFDSGLAAGDFHSFIGLLWLVPAFMIYLGVIWVLRMLVVEPAARKTKAAK